MEIIKEKTKPARALFSRPFFYLCGPSTLNAMICPNAIRVLELRFFYGLCCLAKLKVYKSDETDMINELSNTEHRAHDPQIKQHRA
mgnify:CR=1 FL=1